MDSTKEGIRPKREAQIRLVKQKELAFDSVKMFLEAPAYRAAEG